MADETARSVGAASGRPGPAYPAEKALASGLTRAPSLTLAPVTAMLSDDDRVQLNRIVAVLGNRHTLQTFKDDLGLSAAEAGETVAWLIGTLARLAPYLQEDAP